MLGHQRLRKQVEILASPTTMPQPACSPLDFPCRAVTDIRHYKCALVNVTKDSRARSVATTTRMRVESGGEEKGQKQLIVLNALKDSSTHFPRLGVIVTRSTFLIHTRIPFLHATNFLYVCVKEKTRVAAVWY